MFLCSYEFYYIIICFYAVMILFLYGSLFLVTYQNLTPTLTNDPTIHTQSLSQMCMDQSGYEKSTRNPYCCILCFKNHGCVILQTLVRIDVDRDALTMQIPEVIQQLLSFDITLCLYSCVILDCHAMLLNDYILCLYVMILLYYYIILFPTIRLL